ncbi:MAG: hypothetical protein IJ150_06900 [Bacteroidales bacterium]|nr:hypothetical protein [Bacteroidales bacterium]
MRTTKNIISAIVLSAAILNGCAEEDTFNGKTPLVKVYDSYLYYEDLGDLIPHGSTPEDSTQKIKSYIEVWAKQQLMIKKAELNLNDEQKDVKNKLEEYRNNLLIYRYKDEFIAQNLDTVITQKQAQDFFGDHQEDFKLNSPMVRAIVMQIPDNSTLLRDAKKLINYLNTEDSVALRDFAQTKALRFNDFGNRWITIYQACQDLPEIINEKNDLLKTHGLVTFKEDDNIWLLKIRDFIPTGGKMPFEIAESTIKRIIINSRKTKLITDLESNIYNKAITDGNLEYFSDKNTKNNQKNEKQN